MDQLRCPATVPSMTSIYHVVVWAELDTIHYVLLNRPPYWVILSTNSRVIVMVFPNPLSDFMGWQPSLDLWSTSTEDILSSMLVTVTSSLNLQVAPGWEGLWICWRTELEIKINLKNVMNWRCSSQWHEIWKSKVGWGRNTGTHMNFMSSFPGMNSASDFRGYQADQESETSHWKENNIFCAGVYLLEHSPEDTWSNPWLDSQWKFK